MYISLFIYEPSVLLIGSNGDSAQTNAVTPSPKQSPPVQVSMYTYTAHNIILL